MGFMFQIFPDVRKLTTWGFGEELGRVTEGFFGVICLMVISDYESKKVSMTRTLSWGTASHVGSCMKFPDKVWIPNSWDTNGTTVAWQQKLVALGLQKSATSVHGMWCDSESCYQ
jgi:hypothetical protein